MPPKRSLDLESGSAMKRARNVVAVGASRASTSTTAVRIKQDPDSQPTTTTTTKNNGFTAETLRDEFIALFAEHPSGGGVSNASLKSKFGDSKYRQLVPIINDLTRQSRLTMSQIGEELFYNLVSDDVVSKTAGLDVSARLVLQVIEKAGNKGIWTKDIRTQTNIQQQALNKVFKLLESRRLIKPVKAVTAKAKKLYMLFDLAPAKEISGGPWYTELEFDHEFINELRTFIMHCVRRLNSNGGKGVTLAEIAEKMKVANVSRVQLSLDDVQQLMQTLAFDYMIEQSAVNQKGEALFVAARKVTTMCDFKWWEVLCPDFHFRAITFEDHVTLSAHEPHHHTAS